MNKDDLVFYCEGCGTISQECDYTSNVREWGYVTTGPYGHAYNTRDSETEETWYRCTDCNGEFDDIDEAQITYAEALRRKIEHFEGEMTDIELEDYKDIHGESAPKEPREGRNTLRYKEVQE